MNDEHDDIKHAREAIAALKEGPRRGDIVAAALRNSAVGWIKRLLSAYERSEARFNNLHAEHVKLGAENTRLRAALKRIAGAGELRAPVLGARMVPAHEAILLGHYAEAVLKGPETEVKWLAEREKK
jgi:hypothetical protein